MVTNNTPTSYHVEIKTEGTERDNGLCSPGQCYHESDNEPEFYNNKPFVQGKQDLSNILYDFCCSSYGVTVWPWAEWAPGKWGNIKVNSCTKKLSWDTIPSITVDYGPEKCGTNAYCCSWVSSEY